MLKPGILGGPCVDLANEVKKDGSTPKFNLTYKFDRSTPWSTRPFSKGFRPGGINRRTAGAAADPPLATYDPDYLTNYEVGYKTSWLDNHLRFNGAFFWEDWKNFQFGFLGQNSFTIVRNAGSARIKGAEQQLEWAPMQGPQPAASAATELDAKLTQGLLHRRRPEPACHCRSSGRAAGRMPRRDAVPSGTQLPIVPKFKGDATVRYTFPLGGDMDGHVQAAVSPTRARPTRSWRRTRTQLIGEPCPPTGCWT